jgi:hypothetical protein
MLTRPQTVRPQAPGTDKNRAQVKARRLISYCTKKIYRDIERLVRSAEGIMLAVRATNVGRPALCGVDVLLRIELATDYTRANHGTWYAGHVVGELMKEMGYVPAGRGRCCPDCIAGEGTIWKPKGAAHGPTRTSDT